MIFFLNSTNRVYNDKELNKPFGILFADGVFNTQAATHALWKTAGDFLIETSGEDMNITARAGAASALVTSGGQNQRIIIQENSQLSAEVAANPSLPTRADAAVLRIQQAIITNDQLNAAGSNAVSLVVISGNSANALTDQEISVALGGDPFVRLADIFVPQNATEIITANITDRRTMVKMTRSVKLASDRLRLYGISADPTTLEEGDIWFNTVEGILKFYDGEQTIALQSQSFDWGYYPPDGVDQRVEAIDPVVENPGLESVSDYNLYYLIDVLGGNYTLMASQVFVMPNVQNPFIQVKMGNPQYPASVAFKMYTVDGNNRPSSLIETLATINYPDVPKNDYVSLYLDGSLYTPGQTYTLVAQSTRLGQVNGSDDLFYIGLVRTSTDEEDENGNDISDYLIGTKSGFISSLTTNPLSITWPTGTTTSRNFVMRIAEREELTIGHTDATTNVHRISQTFIAKSKDIYKFRVTKGADVGSPTGDINAALYAADENNEPVGSILALGTIAAADWATGGTGTVKEFDLPYDQLTVGNKYVVVIYTENVSDSNNYTIYFGAYQLGTSKRWNTADGWVSMGGDIFFATVTSSVRKIVVTNNQGLIPTELLYSAKIREYTTPGNYTWSKEGGAVLVEIWGGGGAGSGRPLTTGSGTTYGGGGGGGAYMWKIFDCNNLPDEVTVTVGAGGGRNASGGDGNNGTSSQFNNNSFPDNHGYRGGANDFGGGGGGSNNTGTPTPSHGSGNNSYPTVSAIHKLLGVSAYGMRAADASITGAKNGLFSGAGGTGNSTTEDTNLGGNSVYGGGGGGGAQGNAAGGNSRFAGRGGNGSLDGNNSSIAEDGVFPSGGGGGAGGNNTVARLGGNGANGMVRITVL